MRSQSPHHAARRWLVPVLTLFVLGLCIASPSFAQGIGEVADNVSAGANKMGKAIQVLGRLGGLFLIFTGVYMHYKAHKMQGQQGMTHSLAVAAWLAGSAMMYAGSVVKTTGGTLWGSSGGDTTTIQIDQ